MEYRRDIDGLRAAAIVPVILVHSQFGLLPGGFTGVDVFFVISGYLITRILVRDLADGTFAAARFYARRIRRLVPALAAMLLGTLAAAHLFLMPSDVAGLGPATLASAAYVSNIWFESTTGYFTAPDSELLLHTWSLGVEEQFYLAYPLILLAAKRWWTGPVWQVLALVWTASFVLALVWARSDPAAAFYLLPPRMWELATGGLVATLPVERLPRRWLSWTGAAGLALVGAGYLVVTPGALFPAPLALLPCAGAALVIASGGSGLAGRLLSLAPVVLIGRWSYSLYLWHWPIAAIYRLNHGATSDRFDKLAIVALVFVIAIPCHYLVERPAMRRIPVDRSRARLTIAAGVAALLAVSGAAFGARWLTSPTGPVATFDRALAYRDTPDFAYQFGWTECFAETLDPACLRARTGKPLVLLAGDSFAAQYRRAISERLPGHEVLAAAVTGCAPLARAPPDDRCAAQYAPAWHLADDGSLSEVVLAARWEPAMFGGLRRTLARLRASGVPVTVIGPTVEYDGEMPRFLAAAYRWRDPARLSARLRDAPLSVDRDLATLVRGEGARYVSQIALECPEGRCRTMTRGGMPYHFDFGHLTLEASRELAGAMHFASDWGTRGSQRAY